jgi:hypothetical protein
LTMRLSQKEHIKAPAHSRYCEVMHPRTTLWCVSSRVPRLERIESDLQRQCDRLRSSREEESGRKG